MHHTTNPEKAISECFRVLKKKWICLFSNMWKGGLIQEFLMDFLRNQFQKRSNSKKFFEKFKQTKICKLD